ncbi:MAG: leucine-rich repeat domain-containing protein [Clostridia bacterium]|nr:leucine-rich repeat domain-containing protein [Clostridia bacterium]
MKKLTVLMLTVCLVLSAFALTSCGGSKGLEYELNEDGTAYTVVGIGTCEDTELVIPSKYKGLPVTAIGEGALKSWLGLTSVTIPSSVKTIGKSAFAYCDDLSELIIKKGSGVTIGDEAFRGCGGLTEVVLPEGVTSIGEMSFAYCTHLVEFTMPSTMRSIGKRAFENNKDIVRIIFKGTVEQWKKVEQKPEWAYPTRIERVFCSDGVITLE